jgi:hypothetical protein
VRFALHWAARNGKCEPNMSRLPNMTRLAPARLTAAIREGGKLKNESIR